MIALASQPAQVQLLCHAQCLTPGRLASLEEPRIQVSSQAPCLVRGPRCGQKAGLFLEEEGHHAIWAPQTVHLPPVAVYMLLGADEGVLISLGETEIEAWRGPGPHELQR